jgi:beta-galactosidase
LKEQETMPWLSGAAQWAFKDFSTPVRPENPIPYMNQKGVVQRDFTKKESYYVFQSYWTQKPMVHIYGHSWQTRWGKEGETRLVKVYSNCEEVELFLNGKSLGIRKRDAKIFPACGLYWNVKFSKGRNVLKAVAVKNGEEVTDKIELNYQTDRWGEVAALELSEEPIDEDFSWLKVKAVDKNGILCLDSGNVVEFSAIGDAELIKDLGTTYGSQKIGLCNGESKIKIKRTGENYSLAVKSNGLDTVVISSKN